MSAVLDRASLYSALDTAKQTRDAAQAAVEDAITALRLSGWGKIEKATWEWEHESDDQGGTYISIYRAQLVIDGEAYTVGYNFEDLLSNGDEVEEGSQLEQLMQRYQLAGIEDEVDQFQHALAELADLPYEDFERFMELLNSLVGDDQEAGEVKFTP